MEPKKFTLEFQGRTLKFEVGQLAGQANGSVIASFGDTVVLSTAVMTVNEREGINYLPLTVEFEERLYAAGKIKGSRFVKREGKPQDEAIVKARLIDRALRPRFDQRIRNEIQVINTVLSYDQENDPEILGLLASSLALSISNIPWAGPLAAVKIGRAEEKLIINPTFQQQGKSDLDLIVAGTKSKINMLEAGANQIPEDIFIAAIGEGQIKINELIAFQEQIINEIKPEKMQLTLAAPDSELEKKVKDFLKEKLEQAIYTKKKLTRQSNLAVLESQLLDFLGKDLEPETINQAVNIFESQIDEIVHKNILEKEQRPDGRKLNEVREILCQIGFLPRTHGSALFNRGMTQALSVVTLGGPSAEQIVETLQPEETKKHFIHHYNFLPFSVGETGMLRGPGRREIGHGALAERSLIPLIPGKEEFPYTIRVVSEILSSNGSSSMASVCGSSLALMDAGVPTKAPAAGIAIGLMMDPSTGSGQAPKYKILTDIQGPEDHHGDMDLKIAGTKNGVTGLQMDVKIEGVTLGILKDAFLQAKEARLFILGKMAEAIAQPKPELSQFAPRIITFQIDKDKIREVIGPGGKVINEIIDQTGVDIDIEDSGMIFITSKSNEAAQKALSWIKNITHEVKPGEVFQGKVTRILNFGAFVEILPGQEGLVHISQLAPYRVNRVEDIVKVGDTIPVKVLEIDPQGRINLTTKGATDNNHS
ncbi:MAG: polyribonucleotide nucleotidyltransferase [Parcubacteria group bacterium CG1_02_40_82]|uniref:Polyribonucleotide nucleotidyltransferase n=4 Tax=Candidatus Portnoyibacteriota TaxID=1817913 RepID=A0A2M7IIE4_9BACT|nr:MAG: polyribonucleotide nucleotidyltransferase [Parcubacteria group bacterium CG1_02_40_82]PIQ75037.1 MAG: polyribonucleotide nucleotidyltransferase [Candidatus Portnoybacteria bacterium CG11_big_fil_rev_8_21_14_0_20_40_15]PIS30161.1 MAG: polyribonucleotide nucleotidyltransferase [Candidatus Portnoybacteria bacterium CG08_land_8_20_14_0_20_40_83]PIW76272.1 MAG: polyribonucleotide nucleotidyltransferase [Candidatus Portnoybacteria bacterium CG_4_8_14_3_um_filter_40_10]PIY74619.1 MAG: polyribo